MEIFLLSAASLALYLRYDRWTVSGGPARTRLAFPAGLLCMAAATADMLIRSVPAAAASPVRAALCFAAALLSLLLLVYTLFFSLPFGETYRDPSRKRPVCRVGMYALCRHPGFLWFFFLYLFLWLGAPGFYSLWGGVSLCLSNLIYIAVQDAWTFPRTFSDYGDYRLSVPFLIPTPGSLRAALGTGRTRREHH